MKRSTYVEWAERAIAKGDFDNATCHTILRDPNINILHLLDAAFEVREHYHGRNVNIHILNNTENGHCPEDCNYCSQAKTSDAPIEDYPMKKPDKIMAEAKRAYEAGAFCYCIVFAGCGPSMRRAMRMAGDTYPLEICVSAGLMDQDKVAVLKKAGCDRLNHNLNTSEDHYGEICTTHTFQDRLDTLRAAKSQGFEVCSGMIVGMGEKDPDVIEVAQTLRGLEAKSIPVNFLLPIEGNQLATPTGLLPEYCLRVLSMFRFLNPEAELRAAAGREHHMCSMEVMALYPTNSLFLDGYLNVKGSSARRTMQMIKDTGFTIKSDKELDEILAREAEFKNEQQAAAGDGQETILKGLADLKPTAAPACSISS